MPLSARVLLDVLRIRRFFFLAILFFVLSGTFFVRTAYAAECTFATTEGTNSFNVADNWDCGHVPTVADNATIPVSETANVLAATEINDLTLDGTLTTSLAYIIDIQGNATIGASGVIDAGGGSSVRFLGALVTNNGTIGTSGAGNVIFNNSVSNAGIFNVGTGIINAYQLTNTGTINGGTGQLWVQAAWNNASGTFNRDTGTVRYALGSPMMAPAGIVYHHLYVQGSTLSLTSDTVVNGDLTIPAATLAAGVYGLDVVGQSTVTGGGTLSSTDGLLLLRGDVTCTCTIESSGGGLLIQGALTHSGFIELAASSTFMGTVMNSAGVLQNTGTTGTVLTFASSVTGTASAVFGNTLSGSLVFQSPMVSGGSVNAGSGTVLFENAYENDGDLFLGNGVVTSTEDLVDPGNVYGEYGTLVLLKNWIDSGGTTTPATSTVKYRGTTASNDRTLPDTLFYNLSIETDSAGTFSWANTSSTISNNLTVGPTATFIGFNSDGQMFVGGALTNQGVINVGGANATTTGNLVNSGIFYAGTSDGSFALGGNLMDSGGFRAQTGNFRFIGDSDQTSSGALFSNVMITKGASSGLEFTASSTVLGDLVMNGLNGELRIGTGIDFTVVGATNAGSGDVISVVDGTVLFGGNATTSGSFNAGSGDVSFAGTYENAGTFNVESGSVTTTGLFRNLGTFNGGMGELRVVGGLRQEGSANPQVGTIIYNGTGLAVAEMVYRDLRIRGTASYGDDSSSSTVTGNLFIDEGGVFSLTNESAVEEDSRLMVAGTVTNAGTMSFFEGALSYGPTVSSTGAFTNNGVLSLAKGTLNLGASFTNSGTVTTHGSLVRYTGASPSNVAPVVYDEVEFAGTGPYSLTSTTTAVSRLSVSGGATLAIGSNTLTAPGGISNDGLMTTSTSGEIVHPVDLLLVTDASGSLVSSITAPGSLYVTLYDQNRNMDGTLQETIIIPFGTNVAAGSDSESITLTETTAYSSVFRNASPITVRAATVAASNGFIDLAASGLGTPSYTDTGDSTSTSVTLTRASSGGGGGSGGGSSGGGSGGGGGTYRLNPPATILGHFATTTLSPPSPPVAPVPQPIILPAPTPAPTPTPVPTPIIPRPQMRPDVPFFERGTARFVLPESIPSVSVESERDEQSPMRVPFEREEILATLDLPRDEAAEERGRRGVREDAREFHLQVTDEQVEHLAVFIAYGLSDVSYYLGERERRAVIRDVFETRHSADISAEDLERLVRGEAPLVRNLQIEQEQLPRVRQAFRRIFRHDPDFSNAQDNLAWNALMYRVRFPRDLESEQRGIQAYQRLMGGRPTTPFQWAMVRVLGYVQVIP